MANWKELGEVPDSEEEDGFNSQESLNSELPGIVPYNSQENAEQEQGCAANRDASGSIWDIPDSPQDAPPVVTGELHHEQPDANLEDQDIDRPETVPSPPLSSPLSLPPSEDDLFSVEDLVLDRANSIPKTQNAAATSQAQPAPTDDVSESYVDLTAAAPDFGIIMEDDRAETTQYRTTSPGVPSQIGHDTSQRHVSPASPRYYGRFLRPRKPIQEHPYLIEGAKYSSTMERHGIKPRRALIEAHRQRRKEVTQDEEFQEESQESHRTDDAGDDQLRDLDALLAELDPIEQPPSSSPSTPALNRNVRSSTLPSSQADTDSTSVADADLPSVTDIATGLSRKASRPKRPASPPKSTIRKRARRDVVPSDTVEPLESPSRRLQRPSLSPLSPLDTAQTRHDSAFDIGSPPARGALEMPESGSETNQRHADDPSEIIPIDSDNDLRGQGNQHQIQDPDGATDSQDSSSESDSGPDRPRVMNTVSRRIRGVLPASYLRIDMQSARDKAQKQMQKQRGNQSLEQEHRRGLAQRRQAVPGSTARELTFFDDSDDNDDSGQRTETTSDAFPNQTRLDAQLGVQHDGLNLVLSDDDGSVVEDNQVDHKLSGHKRQLKLSDSFQQVRKRAKKSKAGPKQRLGAQGGQPKITSVLEGGQTQTGGSSKMAGAKRPRNHQNADRGARKTRRPAKPRTGPQPPPHLSILDVIEPAAPDFLKVAARTARRRPNQGRSSPGRKNISLANRRDHVDAASVLRDWRAGSIQPRSRVSAARRPASHQARRNPLTETSGNKRKSATDGRAAHRVAATPRKFVKQVSGGGTISYRAAGHNPDLVRTTDNSRDSSVTQQQDQINAARPAQLEVDGMKQVNNRSFHLRKRVLDHLYTHANEPWSLDSSASQWLPIDVDEQPAAPSESPLPETQDTHPKHGQRPEERRRFRKRIKPRQIDLEAPDFSHAHDPLPICKTPPREFNQTEPGHQTETSTDKLIGLGPYGTQYTHHFETFPLDPGVYFHSSTLIGSGVLQTITKTDSFTHLLSPRFRATFVLGEKTLHWGSWNEQVSSELGIVLDQVAEHLANPGVKAQRFLSTVGIDTLSFILNYVNNSLSLGDASDLKSFVLRVLEAVRGFLDRMRTAGGQSTSDESQSILRINDRLLLVLLLSLQLCKGDASMMQEQFQMEALLKDTASTAATTLVHWGSGQLTKTYADLSGYHNRERGIRDDAPAIHSWVVLLKVLETADIPRASFWDIAQAAFAPNQSLPSTHLRDHERAWEWMFSLLPLVEFNEAGVVIQGQRRSLTTDGWGLPQKLLKRIFQLYIENPRQPPSFNNYCRALVARCHYLVEQWGWRRSIGVIGAIFDFFGSQNLAHLRNEEAYKSPKFLEDLAGLPKLDIEPEDRCFHVFLKLVAMSIIRLKEVDAAKDIRNLVSRVTPNHNRQHSKEQKIHQRDLAALRNHHDLLVTLFWAAPVNHRPKVSQIAELVDPESSHKEACLTNLRAWNQLARFVIVSGEEGDAFAPFRQWRGAFFQQIMQQFDSVESDIQRQVLAMSKEMSQSIDQDLIHDMVCVNKRSVMDVLHLCLSTSLDVIQHSPSLNAAMVALNTTQLQQILKHFSAAPPELDWSMLKTCLKILDMVMTRIDKFEESHQSESQILNLAEADDALMSLDHDLSSAYFSMARSVLSSRGSKDLSTVAAMDRDDCREQIIIVSARLGMRFLAAQGLELNKMFKFGRYGLFDGQPHTLSFDQRTFLALFVATLLKQGFGNFGQVDFSLQEIWTLSLVKPRQYLRYELQLAEQLAQQENKFVPDSVVGLTMQPDYNTNRDLFEFAVSSMRKELRDAGPTLRKALLSEHSKTLKRVMEQMKGDLRSLMEEGSEHAPFVAFVRDIVAAIRTHGSDICVVDDFFYQVSREYSPSVQDPQLQVAAMTSYGLRLEDGDARMGQQLFYFLFNNFKTAMINDKLLEEVLMMRRALDNRGILHFVLGKMLPAVVRVAFREDMAVPLVDVYVSAFRRLLAGSVFSYELTEKDVPSLLVTLRAIEEGFRQTSLAEGPISPAGIHIMRQHVELLNLVWPSLQMLSFSGAEDAAWTEAKSSLRQVHDLLSAANGYLLDHLPGQGLSIDAHLMFDMACSTEEGRFQFEPMVHGFTNNMTESIRRDWSVVSAPTPRITIQGPAKPSRSLTMSSSTQTTAMQGVELPVWDMEELVGDLSGRMQEWLRWWEDVFGETKTREQRHSMSVVF